MTTTPAHNPHNEVPRFNKTIATAMIFLGLTAALYDPRHKDNTNAAYTSTLYKTMKNASNSNPLTEGQDQ